MNKEKLYSACTQTAGLVIVDTLMISYSYNAANIFHFATIKMAKTFEVTIYFVVVL